MGSRYLTDLADVCRRAGLVVTEVGSGPSQTGTAWKSRSRSSGGYDGGLPSHVMIHHTASGSSSDGWSDVNYMTFSSDNRPVANLYINRQGNVWVMAAGATNTNGSGGPIDNVSVDNMNRSAIGIEAANNGTGEPWPQIMQERYMILVRALCNAYGIPGGHCRSHAEWAPTRKIDPAGPSRWASGANTWNEDGFRGDLITGWPGGAPGPQPPTERPKLMYVLLLDDGGAYWGTNLMECRYLFNNAVRTTFTNMLAVFGYGTDPTSVKRADVMNGCYGYILGNPPTSAGVGTVSPFVEPWGHSLDAASGMPAGIAADILQEIRANVRG